MSDADQELTKLHSEHEELLIKAKNCSAAPHDYIRMGELARMIKERHELVVAAGKSHEQQGSAKRAPAQNVGGFSARILHNTSLDDPTLRKSPFSISSSELNINMSCQ